MHVDEAGHDRRIAEVDAPPAEGGGQGTNTRYAVALDDDGGIAQLPSGAIQHSLRRDRNRLGPLGTCGQRRQGKSADQDQR